jgi:hypothetical protein
MEKEITKELIEAIDKALEELNKLADRPSTKMYKREGEIYGSTSLVLNLLKNEVKNKGLNIRLNLLRGMHDIGMSSYRSFENTPMEDAIDNVTTILHENITHYLSLQPLRVDLVSYFRNW